MAQAQRQSDLEDKRERALITIETLNPVVVFGDGGVDAVIEKVRSEALKAAAPLDISTDQGRKAIASLAFKVARSKTALDEMGKELVADLKAKAGKIDAERRRIRDELDIVRDTVRKPLDEWEAYEKERVAAHEASLAEIEATAIFEVMEPTTDMVKSRIARLDHLEAERRQGGWQEFGQRYVRSINASRAMLTVALSESDARDKAAAEAAQRQAEEHARLQREREERIAANARAEAERKAAEDKAAANRRAKEAEAAQARAEADKKAALERERRAKEARDAAQERAKADAKAAAEKAAQRERDRIAAEQAKEAAAAQRREESERNRKRVLKAILDDLVACGVPAEAAKSVIVGVVDGKVRHVKIEW